MNVAAVEEFKLDFHGPVGSYFKKMRKDCRGVNSEAYRNAEDAKVYPTNRRWIQFLDGAEKITQNYIDHDGKVRISELAQQAYGYKIRECSDPVKFINGLSRKPKYQTVLKNAPGENEQIDGFSIPQKRKIYFRKGISKEQKNFVIAHELSHFLLGHNGEVFYKTSIKPKTLHEREEYNEEADRLAAILLMPHVYMQDLLETPNDELARRFDVPENAIEKRKIEVAREITVFCYTPASVRI